MSSVRIIAVVLAVLLHVSTGYGLSYQSKQGRLDAFNKGHSDGTDQMTVEQGIAITGMVKLGNDLGAIETADVAPVEQTMATPVQEVKPDELRDAVTAKDSSFEEHIVKAEEPPPVVTPPPPKPEVVEAKEQPTQVAMVQEKSSGIERKGGGSTAESEYLGSLANLINKVKFKKLPGLNGTVIVRFKIDKDGQLISHEVATSSGSKVLDGEALAAIERAAPFPPRTHQASAEPLTITVPFKFVTR